MDKLMQLNTFVKAKFRDARNNRGIVREYDLQKWAVEKNRDVQLANFSASARWLHDFKKKNSIVSRKVLRVVSRSDLRSIDEIQTSANAFVQACRSHFTRLPLGSIMNTDQSGFNIEFLAGRTLETIGTKKVEGRIEQQHSATHSYTIQPLITASGQLISPLFIVLQEKDGMFGPVVQQTMFKYKEVHAVASSSGKVTKEVLKKWFLDVYFPNVANETCLIADSYNTYRDRESIDKEKPPNSKYVMEILPKGSTSIAQPLDVYFFRLYKAFTRRICTYMNFHHTDVEMHLRNNILKLHTIIHNQFRSPRFFNCFKHAWVMCGYLEHDGIRHTTPLEFCFQLVNSGNVPNCNSCDQFAFIRCAWCKLFFCMHHFFISDQFHYCENYIG